MARRDETPRDETPEETPGPPPNPAAKAAAPALAAVQLLKGTASNAPNPGAKQDWVALVPVGKEWATGMPYKYVADGPFITELPTTPGQYEFVLYLNNGYVVGAKSQPISVSQTSSTPAADAMVGTG